MLDIGSLLQVIQAAATMPPPPPPTFPSPSAAVLPPPLPPLASGDVLEALQAPLPLSDLPPPSLLDLLNTMLHNQVRGDLKTLRWCP